MSWMKRRGHTNPSPTPSGPPVQMYNPNQHSTKQENQWQHDINPSSNNWYHQVPQNQQQQVEYNSPQQQTNFWQPYNQQQQYKQNVTSQYPTQYVQHGTTYPPSNELNTANDQYGQLNQQYDYQMQSNAAYGQQQPANPDGDSWNWGWGDEDNSNNVQALPTSQQNSNVNVNQASNIAESFANEKSSWNWSLDETKTEQSSATTSLTSLDSFHPQQDHAFQKMGKLAEKHRKTPVMENLDQAQSLLMKRGKMDHLTPQWSIESQLSQESSDDVLQTSESDKILSRSSTISQSPISGHDVENLPQIQELHVHDVIPVTQEPPVNFEEQSFVRHHENKENLASVKQEVSPSIAPPLPIKNQTPPLLPMQSSSSDDLKNPYKRTTAVSHKAASKYRTSSVTPPENKSHNFYQLPNFPQFTQSVNLETLPDNSEQPDPLPVAPPTSLKPGKTHQLPENNEVAPITERNQYLETGQLSDDNTNNDTFPPPGLRRMVLGQMENNDVQLSDEPPPGISRIVLGQTESSSSLTPHNQTGPPAGLHRMVPGESSSPEATARLQYQYQDDRRNEDYNSEVEMNQIGSRITPQPRSATIGADTPPITTNPIVGSAINRSETIGADLVEQSSNDVRVTGGNQGKSVNRRESIEGQPQETEINNLITGVRDLTVGTDAGAVNSVDVQSNRRSRQDSTDSERDILDRSKSPRERKERKYRDKDERRDKPRDRDRYSPEPANRDKRYDRRRYRDNRYEDDTDYYSDKERDRRRDERDKRVDYDKKYNSLRKEKEKKRRDPRDYEQRRDGRSRGDFYYSRYEDDYDDVSKSRPSSRSDSVHDSYRDRDGRRHRGDHRRRDPFSQYMQGFGYDPYSSYYQQYQYQYYENLRRTNPQAYAEWYRKYYQQASGAPSSGTFGAEDRASVHSGRSSANDELKESYRPFDGTDTSLIHSSSLIYEETNAQSHRMTPAKFATAHVKANISSGQLIKILPHYPMDGQNATIELLNLQQVLVNDDEIKELVEFPGPLVKGVTHKKTIIEYCENKIKSACYNEEINDSDSYVLMWELMILLIRQNGMVVGTDIAELLMKDRKQEVNYRPSSVTSNASSVADVSNAQVPKVPMTPLKEEFVTNKFREYLIYGSGKEALEWAMKHGLWGHALFLASKLDKRTYANVMMRFANGLTLNDPLQTLYQLLSGRLPAAVTCVADEKWGDWRPHLAMILSNTTSRPELDRKAIMTLADTLMSRGSFYAAQFCYLMAEVGFSRFGSDGAKLVLLGAVHAESFERFATNEAIHLTEIYEYACSLNDSAFVIPEFQPYKYLIATRLSDRGLLEKSLAYLEHVSMYIIENPSAAQPSLIDRVCKLADKLKYNDLVVDADDGSTVEGDLDVSRPDNSWLKDLKIIQNDYNMGLITHESVSNLIDSTPEVETISQQQLFEQQNAWQQQQQQQIDQQYQQNNVQQWQTDQSQDKQLQDGYSNGQYQDQQHYWNNQQQWNDSHTNLADQYGQQVESHVEHQQVQQHANDYWNNAQTEDQPRPQISMPNQSKSTFDKVDHNKQQSQNKESSPSKSKSKATPLQDKPATTGWFGGIWNRLAMRPKNQMKLPDDKNPTIVWDPEKKKWVNLEEDGTEATAEVRPPPKMSEMPPTSKLDNNITGQNNLQQPSIRQKTSDEVVPKSAAQPNMFKLQRARNIKNSYVDVFNPGGKSATSLLPAPDSFGVPSGGAQMNFFIPAAVSDPNAPTDFLTHAPMNTENQKKGANKS